MVTCSLSLELLSRCYARVAHGRAYVLSRLDSTSTAEVIAGLEADPDLALWLDSLLICANTAPFQVVHATEPPKCSQSEIIHLVLDFLLRSAKPGTRNILILGYTRGNERNAVSYVGQFGGSVVNDFPNSHVTTLRSRQWQELLQLVGESLVLELLCKTSIFVSIGNDSYYQLSGEALSDLDLARNDRRKRKAPVIDELPETTPKRYKYGKHKIRSAHDIVIVRSRLFYSRPTLNSKGDPTFGLPHIHLLNRFAKLPEQERIRRSMYHIFPLQYKIHNVFSSEINRKETVQPLKDYTMREDEPVANLRRPRCLSVAVADRIHRLHISHDRTSYKELLEYHCPARATEKPFEMSNTTLPSSSSEKVKTQRRFVERSVMATAPSCPVPGDAISNKQEIFTNWSTSTSDVAAFVIAVLSSVSVGELLGVSNFQLFTKRVTTFISLRRYESMTLQNFMEGMTLSTIDRLGQNKKKLCLSERQKKEELFAEVIYWLIDSFVLPLLKGHFYITESHMFRNRVLYFRHDVWKRLTEPEFARIKLSMLCEVPTAKATEILRKRSLGFAYMRLLPKGKGVRPITNLRRREMTKDGTKRTRGRYLLPSINSIMQSVYSVLKYEGKSDSAQRSFGMNSVNEIHDRLKDFKTRMGKRRYTGKFYFAKADVKSCFDTIEQDKVLDIVSEVLAEDEYMLQKFCAVVPALGKIGRKYHNRAIPAQDLESFSDFAVDYVKTKKHMILVDGVAHQFKDRDQIKELLTEHLTMHIIKIGKKFFRQDTGIPQGSILSSILCNLYYARMESETLSFMNREDSVCFRLIDDFLYITACRESAQRFLAVMHEGNPEYGCFVSSDKSLANFEAIACGERVATLAGSLEFPYCGTTINTVTLDVRKDYSRDLDLAVSDTLTVDYTNAPGSSLLPKIFQGLKLSCQPLFIDTSHNSLHTVMLNIYRALNFAAMRFHVFLRSLKRRGCDLKERSFELVQQLTSLLFVFLKSRCTLMSSIKCELTQAQVDWLGTHAFLRVLRRRPSGYEATLKDLSQKLAETCKESRDLKLVTKIAKDSNVECFADFLY